VALKFGFKLGLNPRPSAKTKVNLNKPVLNRSYAMHLDRPLC